MELPSYAKMPEDAMIRVNQVCNRFEERWQHDHCPKVEEMLGDVEAAYIDALVHELLPLEVEYRRRAKITVSVELYRQRFPHVDQKWLQELLASPQGHAGTSAGVGRTISHYSLQQLLGEGGMGKVFLARDDALGRQCALKILADKGSPSLRRRWVREARTFARLQHPCIASFYDSGDEDGESFIAMELVQGLTLRQRLAQGPLDFEDAMNVTESLLQALGHAHMLGILHRDIKPENIMLTDAGRVKLLDFGLAKETRNVVDNDTQSVTQVTGEGAIIGTVGYMSPEQLLGETLDERADVFSVGAVLYEMITGRPAFPGSTQTERIAAILSRDTDPIGCGDFPVELNAVLRKSLARDSSLRYPTAASFLSELRRGGSGDLKIQLPNSLVVFDFANLGRRSEDDWIGEGMAESLNTSLAQVPGLRVVPRESLLRLQASTPTSDPRSLGLTLGCRWLVAGTFQKMGNALRFNVRLTEVLTDEIIMTGQVDGTSKEIFDLQDRVMALVREKTGNIPPMPLPRQPRPLISAYECVVKGRQASYVNDKQGLDDAREWFERAVEIDPSYAPALTGLSAVAALRYTFTTDPAVLDTAEHYARRAIEADPKLSEPHVSLGYVQFHRAEIDAAYRAAQQAISMDSNNVHAHYLAACFGYSDLGRECKLLFSQDTSDPHRYRRDQVLQLLQRAIKLDDVHGWSWLGATVVHLDLGNLPESQWCAEQASVRQGVEPLGKCFLGEVMRRMGKCEEARTHCLSSIKAFDDSDNLYGDTYRAVALCTLGKSALAQEDVVAARAAFSQVDLHARGRNRARAIGHPFVHALCGLAEIDHNNGAFREALSTFRDRTEFNFAWFWNCSDDSTLLALARAATAVGEIELARQLHAEAIDCGSTEAPEVEIP